MRTVRRTLLALAALLAGGTAASAETCLESVDRFAAEHDLAVAPSRLGAESGVPAEQDRPATLESRGMTGSLAESGGVIRPPDTGTGVVIDPPAAGQSRMPTAPDLPPQQPPSAGAPDPSAVQRQRVEAMLTAARAAAERGDTEQCFERFREAQSALRAGPGQPG